MFNIYGYLIISILGLIFLLIFYMVIRLSNRSLLKKIDLEKKYQAIMKQYIEIENEYFSIKKEESVFEKYQNLEMYIGQVSDIIKIGWGDLGSLKFRAINSDREFEVILSELKDAPDKIQSLVCKVARANEMLVATKRPIFNALARLKKNISLRILRLLVKLLIILANKKSNTRVRRELREESLVVEQSVEIKKVVECY